MPQGTVKSFDPDSKRVVILDDDLRELVADREAFAASGLRELRLGQRVRFELEQEGERERVTNLNIISL
jgi:cold shock CspA family protein